MHDKFRWNFWKALSRRMMKQNGSEFAFNWSFENISVQSVVCVFTGNVKTPLKRLRYALTNKDVYRLMHAGYNFLYALLLAFYFFANL